MQAVWYEEAGPANAVLTAGEMPTPGPAAGEVRVRIAYSAINPTDVKRRERGRELHLFERIVPGNDGSGVIEAVGDGVPASRVGERVWLFGAQAGRPFGTSAEFCCVPARYAQPLPKGTSLKDGACLGVPAVTAHRALFADGPVDGLTVLVMGGAGRVGRYAVQLAKWRGAQVVATASSEAKRALARELGADHTVDYRRPDVGKEIRRLVGGVDRVVEVAFADNIPTMPEILNPNATISAFASDNEPEPRVPFHALMYNNTTIRLFSIYGMPETAKDEAFRDIGAALAEGRLSHAVGCEFPFADAVRGHEAVEWGECDGAALLEIDATLEG